MAIYNKIYIIRICNNNKQQQLQNQLDWFDLYI
jgi:hypothetical protein